MIINKRVHITIIIFTKNHIPLNLLGKDMNFNFNSYKYSLRTRPNIEDSERLDKLNRSK